MTQCAPHDQRHRETPNGKMFPDTWRERNKAVCAAALEYAGMEFHVIVLYGVNDDGGCACPDNKNCKDAGKHPVLKRGLKEATRDEQKISEWFGVNAVGPRNLGIVTGEISGLTVIDVDIADGKGGAESWHEATKNHGEPNTLMAQTGSGGMHVLFKYNSSLKTTSNVLGKGVDVRNNGGYIVAAPSRHRSGGSYSWLNWGEKLADLPEHLSHRKETRGWKPKSESSSTKYTIEQVRGMLEVVPADDRDLWRNVGIILGRYFNRMDAAWEVYQDWANKAGGKKGRNHDAIAMEAFYELSQQNSENQLTIGTIVKAAQDNGWAPDQDKPSPDGRVVFDGPANAFIDLMTGNTWLGTSIDSSFAPMNDGGRIVKPSEWVRNNRTVYSRTTNPAYPYGRIPGMGCGADGEVFPDPKGAFFNDYRKASIALGDPKAAQPFVDHVAKIFNKPGDADQVLNYMAHRVQRPEEKPRFALLIAGGQGVGKDTVIEMCCPAIGAWNVANIDPAAFDSQFNEFAASTLVRINETSNLHEMSRWAFNERTKVLIAGSPDNATINPKYGQKFSVRMFCGVILTTNHMLSGIYIPADDRRYDVIECATLQEMGLSDSDTRRAYFAELWEWFNTGGASHIAAFLHERDISRFSASNGQRKTEAHKNVVQAGMTGDHWLDDIIDELGSPVGVRADWIVQRAVAGGEKEADVRRKLANSIARLGYSPFRNPALADGRWKIGGKKVVVYVQQGTPSNFDPRIELDKEPF